MIQPFRCQLLITSQGRSQLLWLDALEQDILQVLEATIFHAPVSLVRWAMTGVDPKTAEAIIEGACWVRPPWRLSSMTLKDEP
ncbi:MAG: hypothetical protein VKK59_01435 [Vampirovibrionales bacterium]|nr:hypothetical protein [Vampirovibrionales bacterium]